LSSSICDFGGPKDGQWKAAACDSLLGCSGETHLASIRPLNNLAGFACRTRAKTKSAACGAKRKGRHRAAPHIDDDMSAGSSEPSERPYARVLGESCWRPLEPHGLASAGGIQ